jgi:hypothetical protein
MSDTKDAMNGGVALAQVHRFDDCVAVYVGVRGHKGKTVYLSPREANDLARALNACASDVRKRNQSGRFTTFQLNMNKGE